MRSEASGSAARVGADRGRAPRTSARGEVLAGVGKGAFSLLLLLFVLTAAACTDREAAEADPDGTVVRDSAGITVRRVPGPTTDRGGPGAIPSRPVLEIGGRGSEDPVFYRLAGGALLSGGAIVVAERQSREIRYYSASGEHVRTVGGEGGGPTEHREIGALVQAGPDTLLVHDPERGRVVAYDGRGKIVRTLDLPRGVPRGELSLVGRTGGRLLFSVHRVVAATGPDREGIVRAEVPVLAWEPGAPSMDTLAFYPGEELYVSREGRSVAVVDRPFGRRTDLAARGARWWAVTAEGYELRVHRADGSLERIVRVDDRPPEVTDRDREARLRSVLARSGENGSARRRLRSLFRKIPLPERFPGYVRVVSDGAGRVWAKRAPPPGAEQATWTVLDGRGRVRAQVRLPDGFRPYDIDSTLVLGRHRSDLGVETIRLLRLANRIPGARSESEARGETAGEP